MTARRRLSRTSCASTSNDASSSCASYPTREIELGNYVALLAVMGKIAAAIAAVRRDAGLDRE